MDCYIEASNYDIREQVLIELILIWFCCWAQMAQRGSGAGEWKGGCFVGTAPCTLGSLNNWGRMGFGWKTNGNVDTHWWTLNPADRTDEAAAILCDWQIWQTVTGSLGQPPASRDTRTSLIEFASLSPSDPHLIVTGQVRTRDGALSRSPNWNQSPHWAGLYRQSRVHWHQGNVNKVKSNRGSRYLEN